MKSRILCTLLALVMVLSVLSACGGTANEPAAVSEDVQSEAPAAPEESTDVPSEEPAAPDEAAQPQEEPEEELGPLGFVETPHDLPLLDSVETFTLFTSVSPMLGENLPPLEDNMVFQEMEKLTNVHVDITSISPFVFNEKFNLMIASGDWTDLLNNVRSTYSGGLASALGDDIIIDLNEYKDYMPNYYALIHSDENTYRDVSLGGESLGAFFGLYSDTHELDSGLMVRGDWLDKLGLEAPETVDEYYNVLTAFHNMNGSYMHLPTNGEMANQAFLCAYDVAGFYIDAGFFTSLQCYTVRDGKLICGFEEEGFKQYLQLLNKWYSEGLISQDYMSSTSTSNYLNDCADAKADMLNDKIGVWGDSVNAAVNYTPEVATDPDFRVQPTKLPTLEKGDTIKCGQYISRLDEAYYSISTTCEDPETLVQWVDIAYTSQGYDLFNWGVEGKTYTANADGSKQYTDLILDNPDGYTLEQAKFAYLGTGSYVHDLTAYHAVHTDLQMECFDVWNSNFTGEYGVTGWMAMTVEEGERFSQLSGDIITYLSESVAKFIVGDMNFEGDYETFQSHLKTLQIDDLTELQQGAYDRWVGVAE